MEKEQLSPETIARDTCEIEYSSNTVDNFTLPLKKDHKKEISFT